MRGKILLQALWSEHLDWDDNIDSEDLKLWKLIKHDLEQISNCRIQRCLKIERNSDRVTHKLVCFCDASTKAYAAVIYLLQTNSEGKNRADLIFSKSRLAPVKDMTIPRLELMGVLIGVRCLDFVESQLTCSLETIIVMTDSQCVLNWLKSDKDQQTFVKHRIQEIRGHENLVFRYVKSKENPGDIASRGMPLKELKNNHLWWFGPEWLTKHEHHWSNIESELVQNGPDIDLEVASPQNVEEAVLLHPSSNVLKRELCVKRVYLHLKYNVKNTRQL